MTQDQIVQVLHKVIAENQNFTTWTVSTPHLVSLVNYAIEAEREACAERAWKALINKGADWSVRQLVSDAITQKGET